MRLGVSPPVEAIPVPAAIDLCVRAEGLGYTDVWTAEVAGTDAFSPLAAVAVRTERVRLGTGIVPIYTRPPALTAMSAAGLQALSGGRFVLGVGVSSPAIVEGWMGTPLRDPMERVREYVEILREALAMKKVTYEGETLTVRGFRLQVDPGAPVPIYLAALGPRMCRLAGRIADGVQFFMVSPEGVRAALGHVAEGAREAGRDPADIDVFIRLFTVMDEPEDLVRFMARRLFTGYAIVPGYHASLARQGFADEAAAIAVAWAAGERERATERFSDEMLDAFLVSGDADACLARIDDYREAGVLTPVVLPISFAGSAEERTERVDATVRALAPVPGRPS